MIQSLTVEEIALINAYVLELAEHTKNKTKSNKPKHEGGEARRARDGGGEKGDDKRGYPRNPPGGWKDWRGPWPPKK